MSKSKWKWKYEVGDIIDNIQIINKKVEQKPQKSNRTKSGTSLVTNKYYQYKCLKCGFEGNKSCYKNGNDLNEHWVHEEALVQGVRCACCHGTVVQTGINDLATTDPDVVKYFVDKSLSKKFSRSARYKIDIMCPICGFINPNKVTIYNLVWEGSSCLRCGNTISYPEKLMYFLLKQLNIPFEFHKVFDWSKRVFNEYNGTYGSKEYDFYIPDYNLIVELNGRQHYKDGTPFSVYGKSGRSLQSEQQNDILKQNLAIQNNYKYIVIDCKNSNLDYIKNNICRSELSNYINITNIEWNKCHKSALSGIKMLVINEKAANQDMSSTKLAQKYGVSIQTIISWLKQGSMLCGYDAQEEIKKSSFYANHARFVYSPQLNMAFDSIKNAASYIQIAPPNISQCLSGKNKHAGKHPDTRERLTWQYYTKEQYEEWCKTSNQASESLCNFNN